MDTPKPFKTGVRYRTVEDGIAGRNAIPPNIVVDGVEHPNPEWEKATFEEVYTVGYHQGVIDQLIPK